MIELPVKQSRAGVAVKSANPGTCRTVNPASRSTRARAWKPASTTDPARSGYGPEGTPSTAQRVAPPPPQRSGHLAGEDASRSTAGLEVKSVLTQWNVSAW